MIKALHNERGAVALLTTIIISVLIALLLMALVTLMIAEQRQQDDDEQAVTAYLAAESGVEDAVYKVVSGAAIGSGCNTGPSWSSAQVTCELITTSGNPTGTLSAADKTIQIDSGSGYDNVTISWDTSSGHPASYYSSTCTAAGCPAPGGVYPYAPPLEAAIAEYPTGSFAAGSGSVRLKNALFIPNTSGTNSIDYNVLGAPGNGNNPVSSLCVAAAAAYHCTARVTGLQVGKNYIFRLHSRFVGTSYKLQFFNGASPVNVPDGTTTIDVTAKAGSTTRRVLYKVPTDKTAASGLDYVIFSDNAVSKDFCIIGGSPTTSGC